MPRPAPPRRPLRAAALLPVALAALGAVIAAQMVGHRFALSAAARRVRESSLSARPHRAAPDATACSSRGTSSASSAPGRGSIAAGAVSRRPWRRSSRQRRTPRTDGLRPRGARSSAPCAARRGTRPSSSGSSSRRCSTRSRAIATRRCARRRRSSRCRCRRPVCFARRRVALLRRGLAALARAFAHASRDGDARVLARAARASPLVHWAMRYAAAIVAVDRGRAGEVQALLSGAPEWPDQSAFHTYHDELLAQAST